MRRRRARLLRVVYNNLAGQGPITMSFASAPAVTAVMVSQPEGQGLRDWLSGGATGTVTIRPSSELSAVPGTGDVLASFSSRGPSIIHAIKPDISAVGQGIYSASNDGVTYRLNSNGTSFSAPLTAGAAALLRQQHPEWTVPELKSVLVNSSVQTPVWAGVEAGVNQTGAGRVDLARALQSRLALEPVSISFGFLRGGQARVVHHRSLTVRNVSGETQSFSLGYESLRNPANVNVLVPEAVFVVEPGASVEVHIGLAPPGDPSSGTFDGISRSIRTTE